MNYRDLKEKFDKVVIVGMIEHVGYKNYKTIFNIVNKSLKKDGLFVLHTIGGEGSVRGIDSWIEKYIFPNSMLPSVKQIADAAEGLFIMEDWHNFSAYYDKTLHAWKKNFLNSWDILKIRYDERFKRMWIYYFMASAGSFRSRRNQLWQVVFSKKGVSDVYNAPR
jgi:cyclopropane-fatty-acyl-phospholipid synthase